MCELLFDFDQWAIKEFVIGEKYFKNTKGVVSENFYEQGWSVNISDGVIDNVFFCFSDGYNDYREFKGRFLKGQKELELSNLLDPEKAKSLFGTPDSEWNDGVELNIQFVVSEHRIEFSWAVSGDSIKLDYMCVE